MNPTNLKQLANRFRSVFATHTKGAKPTTAATALAALLLVAIGGSARANDVLFTDGPVSPGASDNGSYGSTGDIDGNGFPDSLFTTASGAIWFPNVDGKNFGAERRATNAGSGAGRSQLVDLDCDGDLDVVVQAGILGWAENLGGGDFGATDSNFRALEGAGAVSDVAFYDIDQDGKLDYVFATLEDNVLRWRRALDDAAFEMAPQTIANLGTPGTSRRVLAGDLDNNGFTDFVVSSGAPDNALILVRDQSGDGWSSTVLSNQSGDIEHMALADLDCDNLLDILVSANTEGELAWYRNLGGGSFGTPGSNKRTITASPGTPRDCGAADFDLDGDLDVFMAVSGGSRVIWCENTDGRGTFAPLRAVASGANYATTRSSIAVDWDLDGDMDVLSVAPGGSNTFRVALNNTHHRTLSGSSFGARQNLDTTLSFPISVETGDIDGDGLKDVAFASSNTGELGWRRNNGDGSFGGKVGIPSLTADASQIALADLDQDGDLDAAVSGSSGTLNFWVENLNGLGTTWAPRALTPGSSTLFAMAAADMDKDGLVDLISGGDGRLAVWLNQGGTFGSPLQFSAFPSGSVQHVDIGDVNGDGFQDIVTGTDEDDFVVCMLNTGGSPQDFTQVVVDRDPDGTGPLTANLIDPRDFQFADIDLDGDLDIYAAGYPGAVCWYENRDGSGASWQFHGISPESGDNGIRGIRAFDVDNDGDMDLFTVSELNSDLIVYENRDRAGAFNRYEVFAGTSSQYQSVAPIDYDKDGRVDIAAAGSTGVFYGQNVVGSFTFGWNDNGVGTGNAGELEPLFFATLFNRGRNGDQDIRFSELGLQFGTAAAGLYDGDAVAERVSSIQVWEDLGTSGVFEPGIDQFVADLGTASGAGTSFLFSLPDTAELHVSASNSRRYAIIGALALPSSGAPSFRPIWLRNGPSASAAKQVPLDVPLTTAETSNFSSSIITIAAPALEANFDAPTSLAFESGGIVNVPVSLTGNAAVDTMVSWSVGDNTATFGADYNTPSMATTGSTLIAAGTASANIQIQVNTDATDELLDEDFTITLTGSDNATIGANNAHVFTIRDVDPTTVRIATAPQTVNEDVDFVEVTLTLDNAEASLVEVLFDQVDGTASLFEDHFIDNFIPSFNPGETTTTATIFVIDDQMDEPDETALFGLGFTFGNAVSDPSASYALQIVDNDAPPVVRFGPWVPDTDGEVRAIVQDEINGYIYVGGAFNTIGGHPIRNLAVVNAVTGQVETQYTPDPDGAVNALLLHNGWLYAGGEFNRVNEALGFSQTLSRGGLGIGMPAFFITAFEPYFNDGKFTQPGFADTQWTPDLDAPVHALLGESNVIYAGGDFTQYDGKVGVDYLVAFNEAGQFDTIDFGWNPGLDDSVYALATDGANLYVGGRFTSAEFGTTDTPRLAAVSLSNFDLPAIVDAQWRPAPDSDVFALAYDGDSDDQRLYVGGQFASVDDQNTTTRGGGNSSRQGLAAYHPAGQPADLDEAWIPSILDPGVVRDLKLANGSLLVGGAFDTIGGAAGSNIALYNLANDVSGATPSEIRGGLLNGPVFAVDEHYRGYLAGGLFSNLGGASKENLAVIGVTPRVLTEDPTQNLDLAEIVLSAPSGFDIQVTVGANASGSAAFGTDFDFGAPLNPITVLIPAGQTVGFLEVMSVDDNLHEGAINETIEVDIQSAVNATPTDDNSSSLSYLIIDNEPLPMVDILTPTPSVIEPKGQGTFLLGLSGPSAFDVTVDYDLVAAGTTATENEDFAFASSPRTATISAGSTSGFFNIDVFDDPFDESDETVGVELSNPVNASLGMVAQGALTILDDDAPPTVRFAPYIPDANGQVNAIYRTPTKVYVGGNFSVIGGVARNNLAAVDPITGNVDPVWNPSTDGPVSAIYAAGGWVYAGGAFATVNGDVSRANLAAFEEATGSTFGVVDPSWTPDPNNFIATLEGNGAFLYAGGGFNMVGGATRGSAAALSLADGSTPVAVDAWDPGLDDTVFDIELFSNTHVYIAGDFTSALGGGFASPGLVAVTPAGAPISAFNWSTGFDGMVLALLSTSDKIYVGGSFTTAAGLPRGGVAAFDHATNGSAVVDPWNPDVNGAVQSIAQAGDRIYIGGSYNMVNGGAAFNSGVSAFEVANGVNAGLFDATFPSDYNGPVLALEDMAVGVGVYVGGNFSETSPLSGRNLQPRRHRQTASEGDGSVFVPLVLTPAASGIGVDASMAVTTPTLALEAVNGADFNLAPTFHVLFSPGQDVSGFLANLTEDSESEGDEAFAVAITGASNASPGEPTTGEVVIVDNEPLPEVFFAPVAPETNGQVFAMVHGDGGYLYVGGQFTTINGVARNNLAAIDNLTGEVIGGWDPDVNGPVNALELRGSMLYVGGEFTLVNGSLPANNLAAVGDLNSMNPASADPMWTPNPDGAVTALAVGGSNIYVGGEFATIAGASVSRLAALSLSNFATPPTPDDAWLPNPDGAVNALMSDDFAYVYVGGAFANIGGAPRSGLAAIPLANGSESGAPDVWAPAIAGGAVRVLRTDFGSAIFAGGDFAAPNALAAAFNSAGQPAVQLPWNPNIGGLGGSFVSAMTFSKQRVYLGGFFADTTRGGAPPATLAAFDPVTGDVQPFFGPDFDGPVLTLAPAVDGVFAGGSFATLNGSPQAGLAGVPDRVFNEDAGTVAYTVVLNPLSGLDVAVSYDRTSGTATPGVDFADTAPDTLFFSPGQASATFTVDILTDGIDEDDVEFFGYRLTGATNALVGEPSTAPSAIIDIDGPPTVSFQTATISTSEESFVSVVLSLSATVTAPSTVEVLLLPSSTATNGLDYTPLSTLPALVTFNPGDTSMAVDFIILDDFLGEGDETIELQLANPNGLVIGAIPNNTITIFDDEPAPEVKFGPVAPEVFTKGTPSGDVVYRDGDTIYAAGSFFFTQDIFVDGVVAFDARTGLVDRNWRPGISGSVYSIVVHNGVVYLGGSFDAVPSGFRGGQVISNLAAFEPANGSNTGALDETWNPAPNGTVWALEASGNRIFAGGDFTLANGDVNAVHLAAFEEADGISTGALDSVWGNPDVNGSVYALEIANGSLYVGGSFDVALGENAENLAAYTIADGATGAGVDPAWFPNPNFAVYALHAQPEGLYVGGEFDFVLSGAVERTFAALFNYADGSTAAAVDPWSPVLFGFAVYDIDSRGDRIYVAGVFDLPGTVIQERGADDGGRGIITIDNLLAWTRGNGVDDAVLDEFFHPQPDGEVYSIALANDGVYIAGFFDGTNQNPQQGLSAAEHRRLPEGTTNVGIDVVVLPPQERQDVTFSYDNLAIGAAVLDEDFVISAGVPNSATIAAGTSFVTLVVDELVLDSIDKGDEDFYLELTGVDVGSVGQPSVSQTVIVDQTDPPTVSFALVASSIDENDGTGQALVSVQLSAASGFDVFVDYDVTAGTAALNADYQLPAGAPSTIAFAAGETEQFIAVLILDDLEFEGDETIEFTLMNPVNATLGANSVHTLTIVDDETPPEVFFGSATSSIPEQATASLLIDVFLSNASSQTVTVDFAQPQAGSTATDGVDYSVATMSPLSFAAGETTRTIMLTPINDFVFEGDETVLFDLLNPMGATLGPQSTHEATIVDDEPAPIIEWTSPFFEFAEDAGAVGISIRMTPASAQTINVEYMLTGASTPYLTNPEDWDLPASGTVTFNPGETVQTIPFSIVDDMLHEPTEIATYELGAITAGSAARPLRGVVTPITVTDVSILDNDTAPTVSLDSTLYTVGEGDGTAAVTFSLDVPSGQDVRVSIDAFNGTATSPSDYASAIYDAILTPGETQGQVDIPIVDDPNVEPSERFSVQFFKGTSGAFIGNPSSGEVEIVDNDTFGEVAWTTSDVVLDEQDFAGRFISNVLLTSPAPQTLTVDYAITGGTATNGTGGDIDVVEGTFTFTTGFQFQNLFADLFDDLLEEPAETLTIELTNPSFGLSIGSPSTLTITIVDDDFGPEVYTTSQTPQIGRFTRVMGDDALDFLGGALKAVTMGDFNDDGFDDLVVGAYGADKFQNGTIFSVGETYVIFGSESLPNIPSVNLNSNGAPIPGVLRILGEKTLNEFGYSMVAADVNGDRVRDLVVGAWRTPFAGDTFGGRVYVFYGGRDFPTSGVMDLELAEVNADVTIQPSALRDFLGTSLAAGDFNADGFEDVLIGSPGSDDDAPRQGAAFIVWGSDSLPSTINLAQPSTASNFYLRMDGEGDNALFGFAVAATDFDGDGVTDFAITEPLLPLAGSAGRGAVGGFGRMAVFFGGLGLEQTPRFTVAGGASLPIFGVFYENDSFDLDMGFSLAAGKLRQNVDGNFAISLNANEASVDEARVALIRGFSGKRRDAEKAAARGGQSVFPDVISMVNLGTQFGDFDGLFEVTNEQAGPDDFGLALAFGSVEGDGQDELFIGAPDNLTLADQAGMGRVLRYDDLFFNDPYTLPIDQLRTYVDITGGTLAEFFANGAAGGGDLNGDGIGEMAFVAQRFDNPTLPNLTGNVPDPRDNNAGGAFVYWGDQEFFGIPATTRHSLFLPSDAPLFAWLSPEARLRLFFPAVSGGFGDFTEIAYYRDRGPDAGNTGLTPLVGEWFISTERADITGIEGVFRYGPREIANANVDEATLVVVMKQSDGTWTPIASTADPVNNSVTAVLPANQGNYGLMGMLRTTAGHGVVVE